MCGICGIYAPTIKNEKQQIEQMNLCLIHRGPDAKDTYYSDYCQLGHTRLSIIDLSSNANQPMLSHNKRFITVFNGEIYNYKEVAKDIPQYSPITHSDTEVILEAFALYGDCFVNKLNGMFAIAIYDTQNNELYLFRDRVGKKPLFYFYDEVYFAFASEIKSLLQNDYVKSKTSTNYKSIKSFLHYGYIPQPETVYNFIFKFPAGYSAKVSENRMQMNCYWKAESKISTNYISNEAEALKTLDDLLNDSVKLRLVGDVPYGTFLSGGIDSSIITAIAAKNSPEKLKTFSIRFENAKHDESIYSRKVSEYLHTEHHEYTVTEQTAKELIPEIINIYDEPYADSSAIPTLMVSKLAKETVTMALSGDGGDELFWGYGSYRWADRLNNPFFNYFGKPISRLLSYGNNKQQRAAKLFDFNDRSKIQQHIFSQEQYFFTEKEIKSILNKDIFESLPILFKYDKCKRKLTPVEIQSLFDIETYLKDDLLVKIDRASMHYALETRAPLLDYRIVEFAINLSPELKINKGQSKYLLKKLLYNYIPQEYFQRPKWGFSIPLDKWLKTDLKPFVKQYLSDDIILKHNVVNINEVKKLLNLFYNEDKQYLYNRIWLLLILHLFLEKQNYGYN